MKSLDAYWRDRNGVTLLLLPFSWIFCALAWIRRTGYRLGFPRQKWLGVPVIVVGNISVGGTGKTPLVIWLVQYLKSHGFNPGIIARGYGGEAKQWPQEVRGDSDPRMVGDEPVLIASRTDCPMCVGPNRVEAGRMLLRDTECNLIISDDGMQHYALARDIEIAVLDGERRLGNGFCLPAGPLREGPGRLSTVDMVVANGRAEHREFSMDLRGGIVMNLADPHQQRPLADFARGGSVHAIAGIGNPERFFRQLEEAGVQVIPHPFPDHHWFSVEDISMGDGNPVLMTEKDAVKCSRIAGPEHWFLRVDAELDRAFQYRLDTLLRGMNNG